MGTNSRACEDTSRAWNCNIIMIRNESRLCKIGREE